MACRNWCGVQRTNTPLTNSTMHLTLHLTRACNLRCDYCYAPPQGDAGMSLDVGRDALRLGPAQRRRPAASFSSAASRCCTRTHPRTGGGSPRAERIGRRAGFTSS